MKAVSTNSVEDASKPQELHVAAADLRPASSRAPIYLEGLNGLRAIAALVVLIAHSVQRMGFNQMDMPASFSVTVFFSLSGFLITFLLLKEYERTKDISIRKFYVRRILRIWPLYYSYIVAVLLIGGILLKAKFSWAQICSCIFLAQNIGAYFHIAAPWLQHYWSLAVEEQFYLFWPAFVLFTARKPLKGVIWFIVAFMLVKLTTSLAFGGMSKEYEFFYTTRFSCMAIGAAFATLYYQRSPAIALLTNRVVGTIAWLFIIAVLIFGFHLFSIIDHEIVAAMASLVILSLIERKSLLPLNNRLFDFMGRLSYGIYVIHPLISQLLFVFWMYLGLGTSVFALPLFLLLCCVAVTAGAYLCYRFIEQPFLSLKKQFAVVASRS